MSRKNSQIDVKKILSRIGEVVGSKKHEEISRALGVKPQTAANWKTRNAIPWIELYQFALNKDVSIDWILTGRKFGEEHKDTEKEKFWNEKERYFFEEIKELKKKNKVLEDIFRVLKQAKRKDDPDGFNPKPLRKIINIDDYNKKD